MLALVSPSELLLQEIRQEFPKFRVILKSQSGLSRWIDTFLRVLTLGHQSQYLTRYHTVVGYTLYLPEAWSTETETERVIVLRHERIHLRQRKRLGAALMTLIYLVPFLPIGLAYGRAVLEWEAYQETLRATAELQGLEALRSPTLRREIVARFVGGAYGWMWPFPTQVARWYDRAVHSLANGLPTTSSPTGKTSV